MKNIVYKLCIIILIISSCKKENINAKTNLKVIINASGKFSFSSYASICTLQRDSIFSRQIKQCYSEIDTFIFDSIPYGEYKIINNCFMYNVFDPIPPYYKDTQVILLNTPQKVLNVNLH